MTVPVLLEQACNKSDSSIKLITPQVVGRVGRYLKNQLTIIVMENIVIIDNTAINETEKMIIFFKYN